MKNLKKPVLYSTMTKLAYNINERYYGGKHYMWCTPYFGSNYKNPTFEVPPSSSPLEIYKTLRTEISAGDRHATKLELNRVGVKHGADIMRSMKLISNDERDEIHAICEAVTPAEFAPMLCVIPRVEAVPFYQKVKVEDKANPLSHEYILKDLPRDKFDLIWID
ncbi:MAG TPA: hypothetical protein DHV64_10000 [Erythrobacter sp.]|jgi:hypothetical protein|nr:hypothetical protein [Erythrobacter sp.]|tara:strand:- start:1289 stop:1780 length:492 start_codon:yes stop_codon:yes gene_type:complete